MFDSSDLYAAAEGRPDLKETVAEDAILLQQLCEDFEVAKTTESDVQCAASEILDRELPGYSDDLARAREQKAEAQEAIKARLTRYAPRGGLSVTLGDQKFGIKSSSSKFEVDPDAITEEWLEFLSDQEIDGRPLVVPTLNNRLLHEAVRRDVVDKEELIAAGILVEKARAPAWHTAKVGARRGD